MADDSAVLSDVDDDEENPSTATTAASSADHRFRDLLAELDQERVFRKSAEENLKKRDESLSRLKAFAQDIIKKRNDVLKEHDSLKSESETLRREKQAIEAEADALRKERDAARIEAEAAVKEKEAATAEADTAVHMLTSGIEKVSGKIARFKNFGDLPKSKKYAVGLPAVAYGVIKRANEIVEEMAKQVDVTCKERDGAREQIEQQNYEIAIEVSQLEATISGLREEAAVKGKEVERLERVFLEKDSDVSEMGKEISELRQVGEERGNRLKDLEARMEAQRPVLIEQLGNISKAYGQVNEIVRITDGDSLDKTVSDSLFVWEEMDMDTNLKTLLEGTVSVFETARIAVQKVRGRFKEKDERIGGLEEKVDTLVAEKQHIGTLLRSALSSKTNEVLQVAENGLLEARIELRFDGHDENGSVNNVEEDEVHSLAGALENTVKASKSQIVELQHLVEALRAESSLHKAHLDAQAKEISQLKLQIKELEKNELMANESVEGLMMDIAAAEEEIARWKAAAEQEAAAGRAIEHEFVSQLSALHEELEEAKQVMSEMENKLKLKEEMATAAMAARDAAENSLRLADMRSTRLRERLEELNRQLEENDKRTDLQNNQNNHRYVCWPWQWLGLNFVRYVSDVLENSNEMELSEPLV